MNRIQPRLKQKAKEKNTALWIIEKDYALSYLLSAIFKVPLLADSTVLKGGTALKKAYFQDYRFSEDLDFSTRFELKATDIEESIEMAVSLMEQDLQEREPFYVQSEPLTLREPHPGKQNAHTVRVQFPYHREPLCRLKIEITVDEPLLLPPETRPILHDYEEAISTQIKVYHLTEIVAEKYRALLQSLDRLKKRGWGANRVCRDYYDLWHILKNAYLSNHNIPGLLDKKSVIRGVKFDSTDHFFDEALLQVARDEWDRLLVPFIPQHVSFETVHLELKSLTDSLWNPKKS
ncbi:nucleotidyl transferase AbiEii/AbiGii toxin family protein [bacterium]|nr:nucleotidyl transferase AbiEii/AbiGii toxin family protein [bacterium]